MKICKYLWLVADELDIFLHKVKNSSLSTVNLFLETCPWKLSLDSRFFWSQRIIFVYFDKIRVAEIQCEVSSFWKNFDSVR